MIAIFRRPVRLGLSIVEISLVQRDIELRALLSGPNLQAVLVLASLSLAMAAGCTSKQSESKPPPAPTVKVANPVVKMSVEWDAYTGRLEPVAFVEVRARVSGYLDSIHFEEGAIVQQGDLLFVIDPRPFEAELSSAKAMLGQAESQLDQAISGLAVAKANQLQSDAAENLANTRAGRARTLMSRQATSQEELDQREAEFLEAKANSAAAQAGIQSAKSLITSAEAAIDSAKAGVQTAELNLNYTRVTAPISGRISREYINVGNLVSGGASDVTMLTTITSVEPIYCTFDANEQEVLKYIRLANAGKRKSSREAKNPVFLGLVDEDGFPHEGHMDFVDNQFDAATASMRGRCIFRNNDKVLIPGMFARIRIPGSAARESVLIPDSADRNRPIVAVRIRCDGQ